MLLLHYLFQSFFSSSQIFPPCPPTPYHLIHTSYMHAHICGALLLDIIVVCCCFNFHIPFFILFRKNTPTTTKKKKGRQKETKIYSMSTESVWVRMFQWSRRREVWAGELKGVVCEEYYFSHFPFFILCSVYFPIAKKEHKIYIIFLCFIFFFFVYS